jgi:hypothetical protein
MDDDEYLHFPRKEHIHYEEYELYVYTYSMQIYGRII